jgi:hypothetical protein
MRGSFRLMVVVGLLFVLAAWLAGPGRRALTARGWLAPALQNRAWAYIALAIVALVMLFTASVLDLTRLLVVALIAVLGAAWIELTRRQTLREFPDAGGTAFLADTWERVTAWWDEQRAASTERKAPAAAPAAPAPDVASRLSALADLHTNGHLTDEEYASAKARVLAGE